MPDIISESQTAKKPEGALSWAAHNIMDPALNAGPLGIWNTAADLTHLPQCHLTVDEAKPYSPEWFVQGFSSGVGAAVPFMLAAAGTSKAFRGADALLAGTKAGEIASPLLTSSRAAAIIGASAYGAWQTPDENHTRLGNAAGMALGFLAFDRGNVMSANLPMWGKALAYPATGFAGGLVMSEGSQLFSNGKLAGPDQALQSAVQGMTLNSIIPVAQEGVMRLAKPEQQVPAAEEPPPAETNAKLAPILNDFDQQYPRPGDFAKLTPEDLVNRGFYHPDATNLEQVAQFKDKLPTLPDPKVAAEEVAKSLSDMPLAKPDGDLVLGELNAAFMKSDKATFFQKAYSEIVPRHHILTVAEADEAALARIAKDNGYSYAVSSENSKGQAVGFLVNPRLKVLGTHSYDEVAMNDVDVDQRPALRVDLQDRSTGEKFSAIAVHLKKSSADMRAQQTSRLANALEPGFSGYIAGDWNTLITKTSDLNSLYKSGFKLLDPADETGTHAHGNAGRIDAFLIKNMLGSIGDPQVKQFYQNPALVALTDHALLSTTWRLPSSPKLSAYVAGNLALRSAPMENNFSKDR